MKYILIGYFIAEAITDIFYIETPKPTYNKIIGIIAAGINLTTAFLIYKFIE